jgi:Family of unknown function (DUF6760)
VPELRVRARGGDTTAGGIVSYPLDRLHEEVAFIAVGLGWSHEVILGMTHKERARWVRQVNHINSRHHR